MAKKSQALLKKERQLRQLTKVFSDRGIVIRREKLARGPSFRVKSGNCAISGENFIFVDKRLPIEQQTSVLVDRLVEIGDQLSAEELAELPDSARALVDTQG